MSRPRLRLTTRSAGIGMAGLLVAGLAAIAGPTMASAHTSGGMQMAGISPQKVGNTEGWFAGETYAFHYTQNYFCKTPPSSMASSGCELGANYSSTPARKFDPLYVIVPLGFTPPAGTLQCPTAGQCIDHPNHIDLTRIFGSGTGNALLPAHSHIVTSRNAGQSEWWNVDVIGVTSLHTWNRIVANKNYSTVQHLRANNSPNLTANIPTNLFLFFAVREL